MSKTKVLILIGTLAWLAIAIAGLGYLAYYSAVDGGQGQIQTKWPPHLASDFHNNKINLILFIHPRCSCSMATLREFEKLFPALQNKAHIKVVFYKPKGEADSWVYGANWSYASAMPDLELTTDAGGELAKELGAQTSGHALLYSPEGKLVFSGGITPARGHEGDSEGSEAILAYLKGEQPNDTFLSKVFGCSLNKKLILGWAD